MAYHLTGRHRLAEPLPIRAYSLRHGADAIAFVLAVGISTAFVLGIF